MMGAALTQMEMMHAHALLNMRQFNVAPGLSVRGPELLYANETSKDFIGWLLKANIGESYVGPVYLHNDGHRLETDREPPVSGCVRIENASPMTCREFYWSKPKSRIKRYDYLAQEFPLETWQACHSRVNGYCRSESKIVLSIEGIPVEFHAHDALFGKNYSVSVKDIGSSSTFEGPGAAIKLAHQIIDRDKKWRAATAIGKRLEFFTGRSELEKIGCVPLSPQDIVFGMEVWAPVDMNQHAAYKAVLDAIETTGNSPSDAAAAGRRAMAIWHMTPVGGKDGEDYVQRELLKAAVRAVALRLYGDTDEAIAYADGYFHYCDGNGWEYLVPDGAPEQAWYAGRQANPAYAKHAAQASESAGT